MAITTSSDFILAKLYTSYIQEAFTPEISLMGSGIVSANAEISGIANAEDHYGVVRFYDNVTPTINVQDETTTAAVPDKIATDSFRAIKTARSTAWSVGDLSRILANENALIESARQAAFGRALNEQLNLIDTVRGILADNSANDSGDAFNIIAKQATGAKATANEISRAAVVDLIVKLEGQPSDFVLIMNWAAYGDLANLDETTLIRTSDNPMFAGTFMGVQIIVNNQIADITSAGTSFINGAASAHFDTSKVQRTIFAARRGGFAYAPVAMTTPVGVDRNELVGEGSGDTTVVYRWGHCLHPMGYDYTGTNTGFVTDTLLKAATSWDRKWSGVKTFPVGCLVYNT